MKIKYFHPKKVIIFNAKRYLKGVKMKCLVIIILFLFQLGNVGFAQQNTKAEINTGIDSLPSSTDRKGTIAAEDAKLDYSLASFPGGDKAFMHYLLRNVSMPQYYTVTSNISVTVTFTIEESGKLTNFQASDAPGPLQKHAIRIIKNSGRWIPAYKDGKPMESERHQKISFFVN